MKVPYTTLAEAQVAADRMHAWMIANAPGYARSVSIGQTLRWAIPTRELDGQGAPIGDFLVGVKPRSFESLTTPERSRVIP